MLAESQDACHDRHQPRWWLRPQQGGRAGTLTGRQQLIQSAGPQTQHIAKAIDKVPDCQQGAPIAWAQARRECLPQMQLWGWEGRPRGL